MEWSQIPFFTWVTVSSVVTSVILLMAAAALIVITLVNGLPNIFTHQTMKEYLRTASFSIVPVLVCAALLIVAALLTCLDSSYKMYVWRPLICPGLAKEGYDEEGGWFDYWGAEEGGEGGEDGWWYGGEEEGGGTAGTNEAGPPTEGWAVVPRTDKALEEVNRGTSDLLPSQRQRVGGNASLPTVFATLPIETVGAEQPPREQVPPYQSSVRQSSESAILIPPSVHPISRVSGSF